MDKELLERVKRAAEQPMTASKHEELQRAFTTAAAKASSDPTQENKEAATDAMMALLVARMKDADKETDGGRRKTRKTRKGRRATRKSRR